MATTVAQLSPRVSSRSAQTAVKPVSRPLPPVRRAICEAAHELAMYGDGREISMVLSRRFELPEYVIDREVALNSSAHERAYGCMRTRLRHLVVFGRNMFQQVRNARTYLLDTIIIAARVLRNTQEAE